MTTLEQLPREITTNEIASHLAKTNIDSFRCTSKELNTLFKEPSDVAKLLSLVQEANYPEAVKMVMANPLLAIRYVSYQKADGTYETISPLRFAFKMLDTYMWKMFLKIVLGIDVRTTLHLLTSLPDDCSQYKNSHILAYPQLFFVNAEGTSDKAQIKNPGLLKYFLQQEYEQIEHIDLQPLVKEYKTYDALFNRNNKKNTAATDQAWLRVGNKLRYVLPRHMLREFCRRGYSWGTQSKFDVEVEPAPIGAEIYNNNTFRHESVLPFIPNAGLSVDYSLIRGSGALTVSPRGMRVAAAGACEDLAIMHHLCKVRTNDLVMLHEQLKLVSENTSDMKLR